MFDASRLTIREGIGLCLLHLTYVNFSLAAWHFLKRMASHYQKCFFKITETEKEVENKQNRLKKIVIHSFNTKKICLHDLLLLESLWTKKVDHTFSNSILSFWVFAKIFISILLKGFSISNNNNNLKPFSVLFFFFGGIWIPKLKEIMRLKLNVSTKSVLQYMH